VSTVRNFLFAIVRPALALAALAWLYYSGAISLGLLKGLLVNWPLTVTAATVFAISGVVSAWRFCILLRPKGHVLSLFDSVRLTFIGLFFNLCLPGGAGGDATRIYYASIGNSGWRTELATIVVLDRVAGLFGLFLWPVLAAVFYRDLLTQAPTIFHLILAAALACVVTIVGMLLLMNQSFRHSRLCAWAFRRLPMGRKLEDVVETLHGYRRHWSALVYASLVSLLIHTCSSVVMLLASAAIDPAHFSWSIAILAPLGFLANSLPVTPGGLGVGEAAFASLFRMAGLPGGPPLMLAWRGVTLLGSLAGLIFYFQGKRRMVHVSSAVIYESGS
jgi:uncharacterized protein (TIRG00374 family)